jgi:hypothetical protein
MNESPNSKSYILWLLLSPGIAIVLYFILMFGMALFMRHVLGMTSPPEWWDFAIAPIKWANDNISLVSDIINWIDKYLA